MVGWASATGFVDLVLKAEGKNAAPACRDVSHCFPTLATQDFGVLGSRGDRALRGRGFFGSSTML
jgi:hypothetical protein